MSTRKSFSPTADRTSARHLPITPELAKHFMFATHGALAALRLAPNKPAFDQLAGTLNLVYVALRHAGGESEALESGMFALQAVARRNDAGEPFAFIQDELQRIELAVFEAEGLLPNFSIDALDRARVHLQKLTQATNTPKTVEPV